MKENRRIRRALGSLLHACLCASLGAALFAPSTTRAAEGTDVGCTAEREPNDRPDQATPVEGSFCVAGELGNGDAQDLLLWTVPAAPGPGGWSIAFEGPLGKTSRIELHRLAKTPDGAPDLGPGILSLETPGASSSAHVAGVLLRPGAYLVGVLANGPGLYRLAVSAGAAAGAHEA